MAGWDEEALLMATLIVADTPDRSSTDKRGQTVSSVQKGSGKRGGSAMIRLRLSLLTLMRKRRSLMDPGSVRFQLHETSFCFVCSHLASGRRLCVTSRIIFPSVPTHDFPENILDHDRIIFLGDLNYRILLPDEKIQSLVQHREWSELLQNDQDGAIRWRNFQKLVRRTDIMAGQTTAGRRLRRNAALHGEPTARYFETLYQYLC